MQLTPRLVLMLATPPAMWATNAVVGRLAINSIDPLWLNAIRWMVAFVLLLPLGWAALSTPAARAQIAARWQYLAILGLIGFGCGMGASLAFPWKVRRYSTASGKDFPQNCWRKVMASPPVFWEYRNHLRRSLIRRLSISAVVWKRPTRLT